MFTGFQPDYVLYKNNAFTAVGGETTIPLTISQQTMVLRNGVFLYPDLNYTRDVSTGQINLIDPVAATVGDVFITINLANFKVADTYSKDEMNARLVPVGAIMAFAQGTVEPGWLECDGGLEDQLTYPTLFSKIGHSYKKVRSEIDSYIPLTGNGLDLASYRDKTFSRGTGGGYVSAAGAYGATQVFQGSTTGGLSTRLSPSFNRNAWTIEGYWKAGSAAGTTRHVLNLGDAWGALKGFAVSVYTDNKVYCYLNGTSGLAGSTLTITDQNLHHIAVSYDGTTYRVFVDGVLFVSAAAAAIPSDFNGCLSFNWTFGVNSTHQQASQYSNWLVTSGSAKYTTAFTPSPTAPDIFETIPNGKFRKPDLRGESLRGWDHGRGIDSFGLRPIGSWQEDAFQKHGHKFQLRAGSTGLGTSGVSNTRESAINGGGVAPPVDSTINDWAGEAFNEDGLASPYGVRTSTETRPRNVAVMFCIKAADSVTDSGLLNSANLAARVTTIEGSISSRAFRNKIINGNFDIWQRNITQSSGGYGSADRWYFGLSGSTGTLSRQSFLPGQTDVTGNSDYYAQIAVTTVAGAGNFALLRQNIEYVKTLSNGKVVVHFWAKADANRNIAVEVYQNFGGYLKTVAPQVVALTNAWKRYELSFTLPSVAGEIITAGQDCLGLNFWLDAGTTYAARSGYIGQQSGTFSFARVQVESGNATNFEERPIGLELALCQRYYEKSYLLATVPGTNVGAATAAWPGMTIWGSGVATANQYGSAHFKVTKRVTPTVTYYSSLGNAGKMNASTGEVVVNVGQISETTFYGATTTAATWNAMHWTADAEL